MGKIKKITIHREIFSDEACFVAYLTKSEDGIPCFKPKNSEVSIAMIEGDTLRISLDNIRFALEHGV